MIQRALSQLLVTVAIIAAIFFALSQVNWVSKLHTKELPSINENKIENLLWDQCQRGLNLMPQESDAELQTRQLAEALCRANNWSDTIFQIHINQSKEINAFAYPGGHIVVNTALIKLCSTEGELLSVISHEAAHLKENHPMKLLKREMGISILSAFVLGQNNSKLIGQISKTLTISAYQREEESKADLLGLQYLINSKKDPQEFITFQKAIAKTENNSMNSFDWIQSHPNWNQRISDLEKELKTIHFEPSSTITILSKSEWLRLKESAQQ